MPFILNFEYEVSDFSTFWRFVRKKTTNLLKILSSFPFNNIVSNFTILVSKFIEQRGTVPGLRQKYNNFGLQSEKLYDILLS